MKSLQSLVFFLMLICFTSPAFSQTSEKTVVITKSTMDAYGNIVTETITKTGAAAQNFNLDAYLEATKDEMGTMSITIDDADGNKSNIVIQKGNGNDNSTEMENVDIEEIRLMDLAPMIRGVEEQVEIITDDIEEIVEEAGEDKEDEKRMERRIIMRNGDGAPLPPLPPLPPSCQSKPNCCKDAKGFMGVMPGDIQDGKRLSIELTKEGPAMNSGLKEDDILMKIDDKSITNWEDVTEFMKDTKPGQKVKVVVLRDKKEKKYEIELGKRDNDYGYNPRMERMQEWVSENAEDITNRVRRNKQDSWSMKVNRDCGDNDVVLGVVTEIREENINGERTRTGVSDKGFLIGEVVPNSAAEKAGLKLGDIITKIGESTILNYDDLKKALRKEKPNNVVTVAYLRDGTIQTTSATLQPCKKENIDLKSKVIIKERGNGDKERKIITIQRVPDSVPANPEVTQERRADQKLSVNAFRAYPNPTASVVNVEFEAAAAPTTVTLFDASGRQLFQEELNTFEGKYAQQFDLSRYAKGLVIIQLKQGEKVFTEQVVVE